MGGRQHPTKRKRPIEFNLALALRYATGDPNKASFEPWEDKLNLKAKLDQLSRIVESRFASNPKCLENFRSWYERADFLRQKRNAFVHGGWSLSPGKQQVINVSTNLPEAEESGETKFTLGALKRELDDIEFLDAEFNQLRVKWNSFQS